MRLRAKPILISGSILVLLAGGCRRPLAPSFDRNQAPETWITAAPLDTITVREGPNPIQAPPRHLPFRYHLYWAGSDPDGKVAGFYFAVTETLALPIPPATTPPPLPGPRPQDYRFTPRTDSVFVFSVTDERTDRQHAFFIYAVDHQGKPDPTPARFIFNAIDRYPPLPRITSFVATGFLWDQNPVTRRLSQRLAVVSVPDVDTIVPGAALRPRTTVPSQSRLDVAWTSEVTTVDNPAVGYRYKLDEPEFVNVGATTTRVSYNTGPGDFVGPGAKAFRLRAVDRAGGAHETSRIFQMNLPPTTWFSGPERNASIWTRQGNHRFLEVPDWENNTPDLSGVGLMGEDSLWMMPSQRPPRRTFYEIYGNRLYARQERDTVHMNSWVVFHSGGFDADSPYHVAYVRIPGITPDSTSYPALQIRPSNGSPIGFRARIPVYLSPNGGFSYPLQTGLYPTFDPADTDWNPTIASYWGMRESGTAFMFARAQDGNGQLDARIGSTSELQPERIVYACDSTGSPTPEQVALRPLILTFFVNRAPYFNLANPFSPRPDQTFTIRTLSLNMPALDDDPLDPLLPADIGGPTGNGVLRYTLRFRARRNGGAADDSVTYAPPSYQQAQRVPPGSTLPLPDSLGGTRLRVMVELCDCDRCEIEAGKGRCRFYSYHVNVPAPPPPGENTAAAPVPGNALLVEKQRGEP